MKAWPSNMDTMQEQATKTCALSQAFMQYLAGIEPFYDWRDQCDGFADIMVSPFYGSVVDGHFHISNLG
jgi:hypothetical protein